MDGRSACYHGLKRLGSKLEDKLSGEPWNDWHDDPVTKEVEECGGPTKELSEKTIIR